MSNTTQHDLPEVYQSYLEYADLTAKTRHKQMKAVKALLGKLHTYLEKNEFALENLSIDHIDAFLAEVNASCVLSTRRMKRSYLRGFLHYLYSQRGILQRDFAPLVVGPPEFGQSKPPRFLRPEEIKRLFETVQLSTALEIRTYAMLHLAYTLGLRPQEISSIALDDISFSQARLNLERRKANNPMVVPLPESTLKAIVTYIIGARPSSDQRALFLNIKKPYTPINGTTVSRDISRLMKKAGLEATAYWLRHTYAQNILENGGSIFEVKEMLGHDHIESSKKYLHIHITMMREVLFNETL